MVIRVSGIYNPLDPASISFDQYGNSYIGAVNSWKNSVILKIDQQGNVVGRSIDIGYKVLYFNGTVYALGTLRINDFFRPIINILGPDLAFKGSLSLYQDATPINSYISGLDCIAFDGSNLYVTGWDDQYDWIVYSIRISPQQSILPIQPTVTITSLITTISTVTASRTEFVSYTLTSTQYVVATTTRTITTTVMPPPPPPAEVTITSPVTYTTVIRDILTIPVIQPTTVVSAIRDTYTVTRVETERLLVERTLTQVQQTVTATEAPLFARENIAFGVMVAMIIISTAISIFINRRR